MIRKKLERGLIVLTVVLVVAVIITAVSVLSDKDNKKGKEFVKADIAQISSDIQSDHAEPKSEITTGETATDKSELSTPRLAVAEVRVDEQFAVGFNRSAGNRSQLDLATLSGIPDVKVNKAEADRSEEVQTLGYETETIYTDELAKGEEVLRTEGQNGQVAITWLVYKRDGREIKREEIERKILVEPVNKVVLIGTGEQMVVADTEYNSTSANNSYEDTVIDESVYTDPPVVNDTTTTTTTTPYVPPTSNEPVTDPPDVTEPQQDNTQIVNSFVSPGSNSAAWSNLSAISGLISPHGYGNYYNFSDNGDGTITVDGATFAYNSVSTRRVTGYDGLECCVNWGCHNPPINHNTMSGIPAQRGLAAAAFGGLPIGTVIFVQDYGLAVIADRHGVGGELIDVCFSPGDLHNGVVYPGLQHKTVYILN